MDGTEGEGRPSFSVDIAYPWGKAAPLLAPVDIAREVVNHVGKHEHVQVVVISGAQVDAIMDLDDRTQKIIKESRRSGFPAIGSHATRKCNDALLSMVVATHITSHAIRTATTKAIISDPNVRSALYDQSK